MLNCHQGQSAREIQASRVRHEALEAPLTAPNFPSEPSRISMTL